MLRNNSKILTFNDKLRCIMGNRILKIFYAVFMALILVALVVFMVMHIRAGLDTQYSKLLLAGYILLLVWAGARVFTLVKDLVQKR